MAVLAPDHPLIDGRTVDSPLIATAQGAAVAHTPVWFMRQAGRSLPEYRALREGNSMMQACFDTDLVTEITLQPVRRHGVDAAIFFSDIVVPLKAVGVELDIVPGVGPVVAQPFRTLADLQRLPDLDEAAVSSIIDAVRAVTTELGSTPLIGFVGAPFTVASYLVEGRPSRDHVHTKAMMLGQPELWNALLERISVICGQFLRMQVLAGASAIQLFDSWVGALSPALYRAYAQPHSARVLASVQDLGVPRIHFGVGTGELLEDLRQAGADVVGVDFRVRLDEAQRRLSVPTPLQGNLDPAALFAGEKALFAAVDDVLASATALPGHIFNLGHGVPPDADPDVITSVVDYVHERTC